MASSRNILPELLAEVRVSRFRRELLQLKLDPELLLRDLGIPYRRARRELIAHCPHPDHADGKNPNWSIRTDPGGDRHGLHSCWGCPVEYRGDAVQLVQTVRGLERGEAFEYLCKLFDVTAPDAEELYSLPLRRRVLLRSPESAPVRPRRVLNSREETPSRLPFGARPVLPEDGDPYWIYLRDKRGWEPADLTRYEVHGHVPRDRSALSRRWSGRVILPIRMNGDLRAYYGRSIDPRCPKRFKGLYPLGKGALEGVLGGWDERSGAAVVVLVEGRLDEIYTRRALERAGLKLDVLSVLGAQLTAARTRLLRDAGYQAIVSLGDGDAAGEKFAREVHRTFKWSHRVFAPPLPAGRDPDEVPEDALVALLRNYRDYPVNIRAVKVLPRYTFPAR